MLRPRNTVFICLCLLCSSTLISPPAALVLGVAFALVAGNPFQKKASKFTKYLLQASVVGLGFGMNLHDVLRAGETGLMYTTFSILLTLGAGLLIGRLFRVPWTTSYLISSGTAICGGSAIAAVAPVINADDNEMSIAVGTVFILNAAALLLFPPAGQLLQLSQEQFGIWAAIAIHDTSSVVGAAAKYGESALNIATTIKLARALWIVPLVLFTSLAVARTKARVSVPIFILLFAAASVCNTHMPFVADASPILVKCAKAGLTLTLFLIGSSLSKQALASVGFRPLLQGITLWAAVSAVSAAAVVLLS